MGGIEELELTNDEGIQSIDELALDLIPMSRCCEGEQPQKPQPRELSEVIARYL